MEGAADVEGAAFGVEVVPGQAEEFAAPQAGAQGEFEQGVEPVGSRCLQELAGFGGGEGFEAAVAYLSDLDVARNVAFDAFVSDGLLECGVEDGVDVLEGSWGEAFAAALADRAAAGPLVGVLEVGASAGVGAACAALAGGGLYGLRCNSRSWK